MLIQAAYYFLAKYYCRFEQLPWLKLLEQLQRKRVQLRNSKQIRSYNVPRESIWIRYRHINSISLPASNLYKWYASIGMLRKGAETKRK